ncbi:MAG: hypothetical protein JWM33_3970 [Caulobacteraceae bacterium]|nr:hypothetical protein [Caulobacteraceae bacterium]
MTALTLILFFIHIVAIVAGGANAVAMPIIGAKLPTATPDVRAALFDVAEKLSKVGKAAVGTLLVTGLLILWLKYHWAVPNHWFWVKMLALVLMLVFITLNAGLHKKMKAGDMSLGKQAALYGQLTTAAFAVVLLAAILAFG